MCDAGLFAKLAEMGSAQSGTLPEIYSSICSM